MIYVRDAAKAVAMILQAPKDDIAMINYNVAGIQAFITAKELESILKSRFPKTEVTYKSEMQAQSVAYLTRLRPLKAFDDSYARKEWGWKPQYDTPEAIIDIFEQDLKKRP
jgi:nucleoside-diphosphate-sugar epimerase